MKKWVVLALMAGMLAGCGSGETKETTEVNESSQSERVTESTSATEATSAEEKIKLKEANFQIEGTDYRIQILDSWEVLPPEAEIPFSASDEPGTSGIMAYGFKKTDIDGLDTFQKLIKDEIAIAEDFQIEEGTIQEAEVQTPLYTGNQYSFTSKSEGVKVEVHYYFLETATDYVVVNFLAFPSFFDQKADLVTEMLNSFTAV
ncbi:hypothetical protein JZO70_16575 [Enterococcus sp. 669A]|uniref:PsbP C-terminal domain-containing protein n=1 Tax=Candidatus Enterococcus moelleringii TaxID=2815325 RepID=A0ABS3LDU0_9ENTE|nr:hypothetical protein [Enterococcus sp. 669A]MBO1307792.1 hypothetical protein [Enterococcus sp. 669A]